MIWISLISHRELSQWDIQLKNWVRFHIKDLPKWVSNLEHLDSYLEVKYKDSGFKPHVWRFFRKAEKLDIISHKMSILAFFFKYFWIAI